MIHRIPNTPTSKVSIHPLSLHGALPGISNRLTKRHASSINRSSPTSPAKGPQTGSMWFISRAFPRRSFSQFIISLYECLWTHKGAAKTPSFVSGHEYSLQNPRRESQRYDHFTRKRTSWEGQISPTPTPQMLVPSLCLNPPISSTFATQRNSDKGRKPLLL